MFDDRRELQEVVEFMKRVQLRCPACGEQEQIQTLDWKRRWRCRMCKHRFEREIDNTTGP